MTPPRARPLYFGQGREAAFGFLHEPQREPARGPGVLICPPFGWDDICTYRPRRDWAEHLTAGGRPVLRFDLPGGRRQRRAARGIPASWQHGRSGGGGREELRELAGVERIVAIGSAWAA